MKTKVVVVDQNKPRNYCLYCRNRVCFECMHCFCRNNNFSHISSLLTTDSFVCVCRFCCIECFIKYRRMIKEAYNNNVSLTPCT